MRDQEAGQPGKNTTNWLQMEFTSPLLHVGLLLGREKILVTFAF
jgi:hypothetical protein